MNSQYIPSQFEGSQNFQTNQSSPSLGGTTSSQTFQNVPLIGSDIGKMDSTNLKPSPFPPSTIGSQTSRNQIPSNQLPPSQGQDFLLNNPFNPASKNIQNGSTGNFSFIFQKK